MARCCSSPDSLKVLQWNVQEMQNERALTSCFCRKHLHWRILSEG